MKFIAFFVRRPVATILLAASLLLGGLLGLFLLPLAASPRVDFPVIMVSASQPGGSPSEMASTIAEPLERHLGAIMGLREMTSESTLNTTRIILQFELSRNIDDAARDVQAALRAARSDLPASLRSDPSYVKANANGRPIMVLGLTSRTKSRQDLYNYANTIVGPAISRIRGIGNVDVRGSAMPAVRVEMNPLQLFKYGIGFEDIRAALASANAHTPKGFLDSGDRRIMLETNDQIKSAADYRDIIIAYRQNGPVRLADVARLEIGPEDAKQIAFINGNPEIGVDVFAQNDANIVKTIASIKKILPLLRTELPADVKIAVAFDNADSILSALRDTAFTLGLSIVLVIAIVCLFLNNWRMALVPAVVIPISLIGTFAVMKLLGYQLDVFSLMALTISTGFVVDDAIVVVENIERFLQNGRSPLQAAIEGAGEVAFTVLSITLSLIVVFLPIILLKDMAGRFFHEFSMTIVIAVSISLLLSLTLTPMLASRILKRHKTGSALPSRSFPSFLEKPRLFLVRIPEKCVEFYSVSLRWTLTHRRTVLLSLPLTLILFCVLFAALPKELMPPEDDGLLIGSITADQSVSFHALQTVARRVQKIIREDSAVRDVMGGVGKRATNSARLFITLQPPEKRDKNIDVTIERLNARFRQLAGAKVRIRNASSWGGSAESSDGAHQYTLQSDSAESLSEWTPKVSEALKKLPELRDVTSNLEEQGKGLVFIPNRDLAARYNITPQLISNALNDAFSQRAASIIYTHRNQYRIVMEIDPKYWQNPSFLNQMWLSIAGGTAGGGIASNNIRVSSPQNTAAEAESQSVLSYKNSVANALAGGKSASNGAAVTTEQETMLPLNQTGTAKIQNVPLSVVHHGQFVASTISFNLGPNASLSQAMTEIQSALIRLHMPSNIDGKFSGDAVTLDDTANKEPFILLAAIGAIYIVLGVLYESLIHPFTILSTLPAAGVGALLAVFFCGQNISLFTLIGIILLIGIVKKNAIMLVDFALQTEKKSQSALSAIENASLLRLRPILMTTCAAALGALPLLLGNGYGSNMRRPLGLAILGGLCASQLLTLYTTPVVYLYLDHASQKWKALWKRSLLPS